MHHYSHRRVFVVNDAAPRRHPLRIPRQQRALVAVLAVVIELPLDHISDSLHASMRVPVKDAARKPILHQQKKRIRGLGIAWRNELTHTMFWSHAPLHY